MDIQHGGTFALESQLWQQHRGKVRKEAGWKTITRENGRDKVHTTLLMGELAAVKCEAFRSRRERLISDGIESGRKKCQNTFQDSD